MGNYAKALSAGATGAGTLILIWGLTAFGHVEVPVEIAIAFQTLIGSLAVLIIPNQGAKP